MIVRVFLSLTVVAVLALVSGLSVAEAGNGTEAMVGTYRCETSAGHLVLHFTSKNDLVGPWLRASFDFPPQHSQPADKAVTYVGFDSTTHRWNIVSVDFVDGSYFTRSSTSPAIRSSHWVDDYPKDGDTAALTVVSPTKYVFELTKPHGGGTSKTTCLRSS